MAHAVLELVPSTYHLMRGHVILVLGVVVTLDGGLQTEGLGELRHGTLLPINLLALYARHHDCLALLEDHAGNGFHAAPISRHVTTRAEILEIRMHGTAGL